MARTNATEKLAFSNETRTTLGSTVSDPGYYGWHFDNRGTASYCVQGPNQYNSSQIIWKMPFSTETVSNLRLGWSTWNDAPGYSMTHDRIYSASYGGSWSSIIMFFDFATETQSLGQNPPTYSWRDAFGLSNSGSF